MKITFIIASAWLSLAWVSPFLHAQYRYASFGDGLTSVIMPEGVTNIGNLAFQSCSMLRAVYFWGNAPSVSSDAFKNDFKTVIYYLPGTTGWSESFAQRPTALWPPAISLGSDKIHDPTAPFGFAIRWVKDLPVVVEASTNLTFPDWKPVSTNELTNGSSYFSDTQWNLSPQRFYRLRSP